MKFELIRKHRSTILYSVSLALLLFLLKWLELSLLIINHAFEIYIGAIALIFTALGMWLALKLSSKNKVKTRIIERQVYIQRPFEFTANENELERLCLSKRELEVLQLMAEGLSNKEIADRLFVSVNTIKTHAARLFEKLEAERRTQAVDKAKKLNIIR